MKTAKTKITRLKKGHCPRVLDLFAGSGGFSVGFQLAGFEIAGGIEIDKAAARTHSINFFNDDEFHAVPHDITQLDPLEFVQELVPDMKPEEAIDVIVGGPPCQSFARVGRAKLREVLDHPRAFLHDTRTSLFRQYLDFVLKLKPLVVVMENVPDVMNHGGENVAEQVADVLTKNGYRVRYSILNAVHYGVPQMRDRMILIAIHSAVGTVPELPVPTRSHKLPVGYSGTRAVAMKNLGKRLTGSAFLTPPTPIGGLARAVTTKQAISDLPPITHHLRGLDKKGPRRFDQLAIYPGAARTNYGKLMRKWPGFENATGILDHVTRYLPRDWEIFKQMNPGDQYPEAHAHALAIFDAAIRQFKRIQGRCPTDEEIGSMRRHTVPPYDATKFPNKWRKMESDAPARTLMAHLGKDSYSHIHFDSEQARVISVREAARLQSFPDGFLFQGPMNPAFRQIGNAIPPLFAYAIARKIAESLCESTRFRMCELTPDGWEPHVSRDSSPTQQTATA